MNGVLVRCQLTVLKDDGGNKDVLPKSFVDRFRANLDDRETSFVIHHSNKENTKESREIVINAVLKLGSNNYKSNWVVEDSPYDVMLGVPWNVHTKPSVYCTLGTLRLGKKILPTTQSSDTRLDFITSVGRSSDSF